MKKKTNKKRGQDASEPRLQNSHQHNMTAIQNENISRDACIIRTNEDILEHQAELFIMYEHLKEQERYKHNRHNKLIKEEQSW